jgi:hypothetical protein
MRRQLQGAYIALGILEWLMMPFARAEEHHTTVQRYLFTERLRETAQCVPKLVLDAFITL